MLARSSTHNGWRLRAGPVYSISSGRTPRTLAIGPSSARTTSATLISAAGFASR